MFSARYSKELLTDKLLTGSNKSKLISEVNGLADYKARLFLIEQVNEYAVYELITNKMLKKQHMDNLNSKFHNLRLRDHYIILLLNGGQDDNHLAQRIRKELNKQ